MLSKLENLARRVVQADKGQADILIKVLVLATLMQIL
jgi:hypothetical protein